MRPLALLTPVLLATVFAASAGARQSGRAQIYATVVDDLRRPVVGLGSEDIVLRDGGVRQVSLAADRATDPLAIAIVADGFEPADAPDLRRAIDAFAQTIGAGSAGSQIGVMSAPGPLGRQVVMLTKDAPAHDSAIASLAGARGSLVDAVSDACLALRAAPTDRLAVLAFVRRRLDEGALSQPERLTDMLFRTRTALWTVEVRPAAAPAAGDAVRRTALDDALTAGTQLGGAFREIVADTPAMASASGRIATVLLSQYVVTYTWPDPMLSQVSLTTRHDRGQVLTPAWSR